MPRHTHHATRRARAVGLLSSLAVAAAGLAAASPALAAPPVAPGYPVALDAITARDPSIYADATTKTYYLYTAGVGSGSSQVKVQTSKDLEHWSMPAAAYTATGTTGAWQIPDPDQNPATDNPLTATPANPSSPEVQKVGATYYMTVTLTDPDAVLETGTTGSGWDSSGNRYFSTHPEATVVLSASTPQGPFAPVDLADPVTDLVLTTGDGTLYVDPDGTPYLAYAHDWHQKIDGTFEAVQLNAALDEPVGDQFFLFKGSDAKFWKEKNFGSQDPDFNSANSDQQAPYVASDPEVITAPNGALVMLWTTQREGQRAQMQAISPTGNIRGPWVQQPQLLPRDRGEASTFTAFDGRTLVLAEAGPAASPHAELYEAGYADSGALTVAAHLKDLDGVSGVTIADTTAPVIYVPSTRVVETSSSPASVSYRASAVDAVDGDVAVTYSRTPGSYFSRGTSTVTVTAKDKAGNTATASFDVIVRNPSAATAPPAAPATEALATSFPCTMPDMGLHDPFIVADQASKRYFLYTSNSRTGACGSGVQASGTMAYQSLDLVHWSVPTIVYTVPTGGTQWNANTSPWAPEVHAYKGKYYLFTTLHNNTSVTHPVDTSEDSNRWVASTRRATIIAVSDTATGPFVDLSPDAPVTPEDFMTLDGTFYVDPAGKPYMIYAHEWVQKQDGTMEAIPLKDDLSGAAGDPILLWRASEVPFYSDPLYGGRYTSVTDDKLLSKKQLPGYVTDGAFMKTTPDGSLLTMWTTYRDDRYVLAQAISRTGSLEGPWEQLPELDYADKGHSMVFTAFDGTTLMVEHNHMSEGTVRGEIYQVDVTDDGFVITKHRQDLDGVQGVSLADKLAPKVYPPSTRVATLPQGASRVQVDFTAMATDDRDGSVPVRYSVRPGSSFAVGTTKVTATARDKAGNVGSATFSVVVRATPQAAPAVTTQPASTTKALGSTATLRAAASGYPAPTVAWQRRAPGSTAWVATAGTSTSLGVAVTAANDGAAYRAVFRNAAGTATSTTAVVHVTRVAPKVSTQPKSVAGGLTSTVSLSAKASGYPAPTVTWQRQLAGDRTWKAVSGARSTTLKVKVSAGLKGAKYRAVFTNAVGTTTSKAATISVKAAKPVITKQPVSVSAKAGRAATFRVTAAASPKATYQWWTKAAGSHTWVRSGGRHTSLKLAATHARDGLQAKVVVRNAQGTVTSKVVTLHVR
ncbi:family 43 glycosylhydrolase [Cellulomonas sp. PhB150]|uniref:family 43 glycosylhydrolase n=1 Tax=Cellulomonas sp. PhB150 TaxID=2485188 RepID=UPI000F47514B|nr:family 43 glycosylhydrolase [Cellulomonas sp. PhB150]ROS26112.1 glycosyl hydrolase family 43 [Cellulomonas sp. PhB150]